MKHDMQPRPLFSGRVAAPIRLADAISDAIAEALFDGRIKPGDPLPSESEIAEEFSVSKPIAREALRQLSGAGLVQTQQGKVARARALSGEPLDRIYGFAVRSSLKRLQEANEMRRVVETGIVRLAAQRRVAAGIEQMAQAVAAMEAALRQPSAFTEADIAFHLGLAKATGNTMIRVQVEGMRSVQSEVSDLFSRRSNRTDDDWRATIARHAEILEAVRAGDEERAVVAIETHFEAADIASIEVAREKGETP